MRMAPQMYDNPNPMAQPRFCVLSPHVKPHIGTDLSVENFVEMVKKVSYHKMASFN